MRACVAAAHNLGPTRACSAADHAATVPFRSYARVVRVHVDVLRAKVAPLEAIHGPEVTLLPVAKPCTQEKRGKRGVE